METTQAQSFTIDYQGQEVSVTRNGDTYTIDASGKKITIYKKQDNEGADHWFEKGTDKATDESKALGDLIDKQKVESPE